MSVDAVMHLAAISNDPMGSAYEDVTLSVNYDAGIKLAQQAKEAGVYALCVCQQLQHVWCGW
jgi:nucleoside-diphosphate-sugar epimerase